MLMDCMYSKESLLYSRDYFVFVKLVNNFLVFL
jgi:hypothetical protein